MKKIEAVIEKNFSIDLKVDGHGYTVDKPVDFGGSDLGTSPVGYLYAALIGCKLMVCRAYMTKYYPQCYKITATGELDVIENLKTAVLSGNIDFVFYGLQAQDVNPEQLQSALKRHCTVHKLLAGAGADDVSQTFTFTL